MRKLYAYSFWKSLVKIFCFIFSAVITFSCFSFYGCKNKSSNMLNYTCFNTSLHVESYSKKITDKVQDEILSQLNKFDESVSTTNENSCIYKFNALNANQSIILDDIASTLFEKSQDKYFDLTNFKFNIFIYPLLDLWNLSATNYQKVIIKKPPTQENIDSIKELCTFDAIIYNRETKELTKKYDGVKIDLGGIAKGFATEKIVNILEKNKITDGYISFGSSSMYVYKVNNLSIRHPRKTDTNQTILTINCANLNNVYISTSGDYERYFEYDGKRYCHIIDSENGKPIDNGIMSATVIGDDGTLLDALSTSLMAFNYNINNHDNCELTKFIKTLLEEFTNLKIFITYSKDNYKLILTNCNESEFTLSDNDYTVKKF